MEMRRGSGPTEDSCTAKGKRRTELSRVLRSGVAGGCNVTSHGACHPARSTGPGEPSGSQSCVEMTAQDVGGSNLTRATYALVTGFSAALLARRCNYCRSSAIDRSMPG